MKLRTFALIFVVVFLSQSAFAQVFKSERIYEGPDPANEGRYYGRSGLKLTGDRMLVASSWDDYLETPSRHYLYDPIAGTLIAELTYPYLDATPGVEAMSENWVVLGEPKEYDTYVGRVFLFNAEDGAFVREFASTNPGPLFDFGQSVAVANNRVLIGEPDQGQVSGQLSPPGRVYIFDALTGDLLHTIERPDTGSNGYDFGQTVAMVGDYALVGDSSHHLFIFDATNGNLLRTLSLPSSATRMSASGDSVAISTGGLYDPPETVYVHSISTGTLINSFVIPSPGIGPYSDDFGTGMAISGDRLLVGAPSWAEFPEGWPNCGCFPVTYQGRAYLFDVPSGNLLQTLLTPITDYGTGFGSSVALDGGMGVIGASAVLEGGNKIFNARAYVYNEAYQIEIDIKPGDAANTIDINSTGEVEVAVLSTNKNAGDATTFGASFLNPASLRFGPNQVGSVNLPGVFEDVGGDGDQDLVNNYKVSDIGLVCEQPEPVTMTGEDIWGRGVWAIDTVNTNDCPSCHP